MLRHVILLLAGGLVLFNGCAPSKTTTRQPPAQEKLQDGAVLYQAHCAACHRPLDQTDVPNRKASHINASIRRNSEKLELNSLNIYQLKAIARVLKRSD